MNAYKLLGVTAQTPMADIKKAYQKLASTHHPDKGGDAEKFKEIRKAYEDIKNGVAHEESNFESHTFEEHKDENGTYRFTTSSRFGGFKQRRRNAFISVSAVISLHHAVNGGSRVLSIQTLEMDYPMSFTIDVPPGTQDGDIINYPELVSENVDVRVTFNIQPDRNWRMNGVDLTKEEDVIIWDLITGAKKEVSTITDGKVLLTIPPMTQSGTVFKLKSLGNRYRQNPNLRGDMYVKVRAKLPKTIPEKLLNQIKDL